MHPPTALLKRADWLWLLAYPLYQTIGTLRHEAGHALVAWLEGATIIRFVFWPTTSPQGVFRWGYVRFTGPATWLTTAAPYICDLLTFVLFLWLCTRIRVPLRWLWLNLVVVGLISPLLNSTYNYVGSVWRINDVAFLISRLGRFPVDAYFMLTITLYAMGIAMVLKRCSTRAAPSRVWPDETKMTRTIELAAETGATESPTRRSRRR